MSSEAEMFNTIVDPETNKEVGLNTAVGQQIIKNYLEAIKNGADSENIVSTKKFYSSSNKTSDSTNYERAAKKLSHEQFDLKDLVKYKYCADPTSLVLKNSKIVWIKRSSGKYQLGITANCTNDNLDIYFNNGDDKIGYKKGLDKKDVYPTTAKLSKLIK